MKSALSALWGRCVGYVELSRRRRRPKARIRSRDTERLRHALPRLLQRGAAARDEDELLEGIAAFAKEADLHFVELIAPGAIAYRWSGLKETPAEGEAAAPSTKPRELVTSRFPVGRAGRARAELCFGWVTEHGEVGPQSDILLQVATDVVETSLVRLRSRFAPVPAEVVAELPARQAPGGAAAADRMTG